MHFSSLPTEGIVQKFWEAQKERYNERRAAEQQRVNDLLQISDKQRQDAQEDETNKFQGCIGAKSFSNSSTQISPCSAALLYQYTALSKSCATPSPLS